MPTLTAVSRERHGNRRWQSYHRYDFARGFSLCSLVLAEIEEVALSLPFGFIQRRDQLIPVAILGRTDGECLYVGAKGQWLGSYIPAILRGYPFRLMRAEDGRLVLHVDDSQGLVVGPEDEGEPFFEGEQPSQAIQAVQRFLESLESSRQQTAKACALLQEFKLTQPWPSADETKEPPVPYPAPTAGLMRIDTAAMAALDGEHLARLNQTGGLRLAFFQTLSERHLTLHDALAKAHQKQREKSADEAEGYLKSEDDTTLSFAWED